MATSLGTASTPMTKRKILDVAIDLFSEKGYHGVSIRDITGKVGIRESSLYNHFQSKTEILEDIFDIFEKELNRHIQIETAERDENQMSDPGSYLKIRLKKNLDFWDAPRRQKIRKILSMEQYRNSRASELVLQEKDRRLRFTESIFCQFIDRGIIPDHNPQLLADEYAYPLRAMQTEYALLKAGNQDTTSIEKKMFDHILFFLDRL